MSEYALFTAIPLVGHTNPILRQADELRRRGWRTAFAAPSEMRAHVAAEAPDVSFVDLGPLGELDDRLRRDQESASADSDFARGTLRIMSGLTSVWPMMFDGLARTIAEDRPDLVVCDFFTSAGMCAAEAAGVPYVVNNPDLLATLPLSLLPPADYTPFLFSGRSIHDVGWTQRLAAPIIRAVSAAFAGATIGKQFNRLRASRGLPPATIDAMLRDRLVLVNGAFGIEYERPLPPNVHMVGVMLPSETPAVSPELDTWLRDGPPVVYVNLGTLAVASPAQLAAMSEAFDSHDYRVLWILKDAQAAKLPARRPRNLRVMSWGPPPFAVLAHPNVKAFVTHCGINSAYEAVVAGRPIVGIPMFADQRDMAVRMSDAGLGLWLDKTKVTSTDLRDAIVRVLNDRRFVERMPEAQRAVANAGGVRRAVDLIVSARSRA